MASEGAGPSDRRVWDSAPPPGGSRYSSVGKLGTNGVGGLLFIGWELVRVDFSYKIRPLEHLHS
jgi:hypothetical protein